MLKRTVKPQPQPQGLIQKFKNWRAKQKLIMQQQQLRRLQQQQQIENDDPSINNPDDSEATGESDLEEDLALLNDSDMGW